MNRNQQAVNPWKPDDEKEHPYAPIEWWSTEAILKTEKGKELHFKGTFTEWYENKGKKIGKIYRTVLFDCETEECYDYSIRNDKKRFNSSKDSFELIHENSFMKGLWPDYEMKYSNPRDNILSHLFYHAEVYPHTVARDITNGYLPMGFGVYKYGYLPRIAVKGSIIVKDKKYNVNGTGYLEHVWGSFSYDNPFAKDSDFRKIISTYIKLGGWWIKNHKPILPKSLIFSSENNPFGYDWLWGYFDNGWTVFYGNSLFYIMEGPAFGSLIISKDGKNYIEFANIHYNYNKIEYVKEYDFYYPAEFEIIAKKGKEKIKLVFKNLKKYHEFVNPFPWAKHWWTGFAIYEAPGSIEGYYTDGKTKTKLSGICRLEPERQISKNGHNSLKINITLPPRGFGIKTKLNSHFLKKRINANIQLAPRPKIKFSLKKISENDFGSTEDSMF